MSSAPGADKPRTSNVERDSQPLITSSERRKSTTNVERRLSSAGVDQARFAVTASDVVVDGALHVCVEDGALLCT